MQHFALVVVNPVIRPYDTTTAKQIDRDADDEKGLYCNVFGFLDISHRI